MTDLDATLAWAAHNHGSATAIGETGFCRGGRNTWLYAAHNPKLKAAVAWYGPIKSAISPIQPQGADRHRRQAEMPAALPVRRQGHRHSGGRPAGGGSEGEGVATRRWTSWSIRTRRTASMPIIARATTRRMPRTAGSGRSRGSSSTGSRPKAGRRRPESRRTRAGALSRRARCGGSRGRSRSAPRAFRRPPPPPRCR